MRRWYHVDWLAIVMIALCVGYTVYLILLNLHVVPTPRFFQ